MRYAIHKLLISILFIASLKLMATDFTEESNYSTCSPSSADMMEDINKIAKKCLKKRKSHVDADLEGANQKKDCIKRLHLDQDLENKLRELKSKSVQELSYDEVPELLNEQQKRLSSTNGFIMPVSGKKMFRLMEHSDDLLDDFYGQDPQKLKNAKSHWHWHRRAGAIGLPPQCSVGAKKCLVAGQMIFVAGIVYCIYQSGLIIEVNSL